MQLEECAASPSVEPGISPSTETSVCVCVRAPHVYLQAQRLQNDGFILGSMCLFKVKLSYTMQGRLFLMNWRK